VDDRGDRFHSGVIFGLNKRMRLSCPAFYSAVGSCFVHSLALGFAATLLVMVPQHPLPVVKVTLLQRAIPLPVGEGKSAGDPMPVPAEKPKLLP
jgi:hypothetical protein